jgi:hypothetical protein
VNPNTMKSGNEPGAAKPAAKEENATPNASTEYRLGPSPAAEHRQAPYLRVLFGITARARAKAKSGSKAFLEWVDGNLAPHREEWRHLWGDKPFPFDLLVVDLKSNVQSWKDYELAQRVEEWCAIVEEHKWNAE